MSEGVKVRPLLADAMRPRDMLGRKQPRVACCLPVMLEKFAHWGIPIAAIPPSYWTLDVDTEGFTIAIVACPCGESPAIPMAGSRMCRGDHCRADEERGVPEPDYEKCPRSYIFTGESVYVAGSPKDRQLQTVAAS